MRRSAQQPICGRNGTKVHDVRVRMDSGMWLMMSWVMVLILPSYICCHANVNINHVCHTLPGQHVKNRHKVITQHSMKNVHPIKTKAVLCEISYPTMSMWTLSLRIIFVYGLKIIIALSFQAHYVQIRERISILPTGQVVFSSLALIVFLLETFAIMFMNWPMLNLMLSRAVSSKQLIDRHCTSSR